MISIDKQYYYLDIDAIDEFIFRKRNEPEKPDEEIITGPKDVLIQKTVSTRANEEKYINVKYDMVKSMLEVIYNSGMESDDGNIKYLQDIDETSIGTKLIFNTLLVNGFVKNKLD